MMKQLKLIYNEQREKAINIMDKDLAIKKEAAAELLAETVKRVRNYLQTEAQANRRVSVWNGSETNPANIEKPMEEAFIEQSYQYKKSPEKININNLSVRFFEIINIAESLMQNADRLEEMKEEKRQKGEYTMSIKEAFEKAQEEQAQSCEYDYYAEYVAETEKAKACERARLWGEVPKPESAWKQIKQKLERSAENGNNMDSDFYDFRDLDKWTNSRDCGYF